MHEWALAEAVLESVRAHSGGRRVVRVLLRFGELQQIDREIFAFALRELAPENPPGLFELEIEPARLACRACGARWGLDRHSGLSEGQREAIHFLPEAAKVYIRCPSCDSPDFHFEAGRGVSIQSIETDPPTAAGSAG